MNFSTDRDLLVYEPNVFADIPFPGQERFHATDASITGTTLTSTSADFAAAAVEGGSVVLINSIATEVVQRIDANTLSVSTLRSRLSDSLIGPGDTTGAEVIVRTFAPQAVLVHDELLRMIGIVTNDPKFSLSQDDIVSESVMSRLEALGALHRIYSGAATVVGENEQLWRKADEYQRRYQTACRQAIVWLDTDGDGKGDLRKHFGVGELVRA